MYSKDNAVIIIIIIVLSFFIYITMNSKNKKNKNKKSEMNNENIEKFNYQEIPVSPYYYYTTFLDEKIRLNTINNNKLLNENLLNNKNIVNVNYYIPSQNYEEMQI